MRPTRTQSTFPAPIVEAKKWLDGVTFPADRPLINLSQAQPQLLRNKDEAEPADNRAQEAALIAAGADRFRRAMAPTWSGWRNAARRRSRPWPRSGRVSKPNCSENASRPN